MTLKEIYENVGGDYSDVVKRLVSEEFVMRFVLKFSADDSFATLTRAMETRNAEKAFRAAHTLKGVAQNLGFGNLGRSASAITEVLRNGTMDGADELYVAVKADYTALIGAINSLTAEPDRK